MNVRAPLALLLLPWVFAASACVDSPSASESDSSSDSDSDSSSGSDSDGEALLPLDGPCGANVNAESLAVITTDFVSGGVSITDKAMSVDIDVATATTDTLATSHLGDLYLIHRYGFNSVDVLDTESWTTKASYDVAVDGVAEPNPQSLVFPGEASSQGYLTLFGSAELQIIDFAGATPTKVGSVDLSVFADDDGNPEAGVAIACGSTVLVGIQRLDPAFTPVDSSYIVAIDSITQSPVDLDPTIDGMQGLALEGAWPRQIRVDPSDPSGETILVLTSGIERVHVPTATRSWAVSAESLEAVGISGFATQAFVTDEAGEVAYITVADGDYPASAVYRVGIDEGAPSTPEKIISGIATYERSLDRLGQQLWVGDASQGASGLRVWDLAQDPPTELTAAPLDTGLPPYTVVTF